MLSTFEQGLDEELATLRKTILTKQQDYGKNNIAEFGEQGVFVRLNDKVARLKNLLLRKREPNNESIYDTWLDIAGYAILARMLRNKTFELPFEGEEKP